MERFSINIIMANMFFNNTIEKNQFLIIDKCDLVYGEYRRNRNKIVNKCNY